MGARASAGVKSYVELNSWASRSSEHLRGYAVWLLARHLDPIGAGCCRQAELIDFCRKNKLWSDATTGRYLSLAIDAGLLRLGRDRRLTYISLRKIQRKAEVTCSRRPVLVPLWWFRGPRLGKLRQGFLLAFIGAEKTIANATLAHLFRAEPRTIQRWKRELRRGGFLKETQNAVPLPKDPEAMADRWSPACFHDRIGGEIRGLERLPNTLQVVDPFAVAPSGQLNKRALNACSHKRGRGSPRGAPSPPPGRGTVKLYYQAQKAAKKACRLLTEGEHIFELRLGERSRGGCRLWTRWERTAGYLHAC